MSGYPKMNEVNGVGIEGGEGKSSMTIEDVRSIGEIIRDTRSLSAKQIAEILEHQKSHGLKFGEAAIALGYASSDEVLTALAQQFNYAYAGSGANSRPNPELVIFAQPFSLQAEAIRAIRSQVLRRHQTQQEIDSVRSKRALAVVSPASGDGKSFFCSNLAVALSQLGEKTLLIDADLRGPKQHDIFRIDNKTGLSGILTGRKGEPAISAVAGIPNLYILPVGIQPPNPLELLESPAFGALMNELIAKFDHVIVDTPAAEYGADSLVVASRCASTLVLARKNQSRLVALRELTTELASTGTQVLGVVVNEY